VATTDTTSPPCSTEHRFGEQEIQDLRVRCGFRLRQDQVMGTGTAFQESLKVGKAETPLKAVDAQRAAARTRRRQSEVGEHGSRRLGFVGEGQEYTSLALMFEEMWHGRKRLCYITSYLNCTCFVKEPGNSSGKAHSAIRRSGSRETHLGATGQR